MRYLTIYIDTHRLFCVDLSKPNRQEVRKAVAYVYLYEPMGYRSNHKNIFTAKYERTSTHVVEEQSRLIKSKHRVQRMKPEEVINLLEPLLSRGRDKHQRKMHPNSIKNLRPAPAFNAATRPTKERTISDKQLEKAEELRAAGVSWRQIGDAVGHNYQGVRTALLRRRKNLTKTDESFTLRTGVENICELQV